MQRGATLKRTTVFAASNNSAAQRDAHRRPTACESTSLRTTPRRAQSHADLFAMDAPLSGAETALQPFEPVFTAPSDAMLAPTASAVPDAARWRHLARSSSEMSLAESEHAFDETNNVFDIEISDAIVDLKPPPLFQSYKRSSALPLHAAAPFGFQERRFNNPTG